MKHKMNKEQVTVIGPRQSVKAASRVAFDEFKFVQVSLTFVFLQCCLGLQSLKYMAVQFGYARFGRQTGQCGNGFDAGMLQFHALRVSDVRNEAQMVIPLPFV